MSRQENRPSPWGVQHVGWAPPTTAKNIVALSSVIELSERIAREFNPKRIILFGSYAYGMPKEYLDVDLPVIMPFEGKGFQKSLEILNRLDPGFSVDAVVRRSDDAARRYAEFDPLIREAFDKGIVLYERNGSPCMRG